MRNKGTIAAALACLLISETQGFSAKTPVETMLNQNLAVDNGNLEIGKDQAVVLISHAPMVAGDGTSEEDDVISENEAST